MCPTLNECVCVKANENATCNYYTCGVCPEGSIPRDEGGVRGFTCIACDGSEGGEWLYTTKELCDKCGDLRYYDGTYCILK